MGGYVVNECIDSAVGPSARRRTLAFELFEHVGVSREVRRANRCHCCRSSAQRVQVVVVIVIHPGGMWEDNVTGVVMRLEAEDAGSGR
jgi:hypothetical protein